jgi:hypothetical protein
MNDAPLICVPALVMICVSMNSLGCKQQTGFKGAAENSQQAYAGESTQTCGADGVTNANLLTPSVKNGSPGNYLEYELSIADCSGKPRPLTAEKILFDIDATLLGSGVNKPLSYQVASTDNTLKGILQNIQGTDLFGRTGANFHHYATDQSINFATNATSMKLRIELAGLLMRTTTTKGTTAPNQVATYLRIGQASPVQQIASLIDP